MDDRLEALIGQVIEEKFADLMKKLLEMPPQEWLEVKDVARVTGLSSKHILRAIKRGELICSNPALAGAKKPTYRIARKHLDTWMERCQVKQGPVKSVRQAGVKEFFGPDRRRKGRLIDQ
jgi:hypothetical protein